MTDKIRRGELSFEYFGIKVIKNINMSKNEYQKKNSESNIWKSEFLILQKTEYQREKYSLQR